MFEGKLGEIEKGFNTLSQTPGLTSAYQLVNFTGNEVFSFKENTSNTGKAFFIINPLFEIREGKMDRDAARLIKEELIEEDISKLLLEDKIFRESIEKGRKEMRSGGPYYSHKDVFKE